MTIVDGGIVPPYMAEAIRLHKLSAAADLPAPAEEHDHEFTRLRTGFICSCGVHIRYERRRR